MTDTNEKIEHPSWCDPHLCTAPEFRPEKMEKGTHCGQHMSTVVVLPGSGAGHELLICLTQSVAPWGTSVFLRLNTADGERHYMTEMGEVGQGLAIFELLAQPIGDLAREFPALHGEQFGYVADATSSGEAPADDMDDNEDQDDDVDRARYQLTVNDAAVVHGTFREIRNEVAELVTGWLGDDPALALEAQTMNLAFNSGSVQAAVGERGEWFTLLGVHSEHATMRIKVTREA